MRAGRLLSIMLLLQVHRRMTAGELARRLEVSVRTIHRDMEALSSSGVPVWAERGAGGGWVLDDAYRASLPPLSETELQALVVSRPTRLLADLGLGEAGEAASLKLLASLPALARRDAEYARQRIHIDSTGWNRPDDIAPLLPALYEAVWHEQRIRMSYRRSDGTEIERVIDPLGLVAKGSVWYLAGAVDGDVRSYRVSRVQSVQPTGEGCDRPEDFDLAGWWSQSLTEFAEGLPRYRAILRVAPDVLPRMHFAATWARFDPPGEPGDDGWSVVAITFQMREDALGFALRFGERVEVLEPADLREALVATAERVLAFYAARC